MNQEEDETMTYRAVVELWAAERESLQYVLPYTARKAAQKALLFSPWMAEAEIDQIEPSQVSAASMYLGSKGGRQKKGLSTATLRAAHLAGSQACVWAVERGLRQ